MEIGYQQALEFVYESTLFVRQVVMLQIYPERERVRAYI